jgi:glycerophosphoryl diester phosphodiesterase
MKTLIQAHRGLSMIYPENTLPAFSAVLTSGADGVELDVQLTRDGVAVVIHDECLLRLAGTSAYVKDLTYDELCNFNVAAHRDDGSREQIPRLDEVLGLFAESDLTVNIELKNSIFPYPGLEDKVISAVEAAGLEDQVIYSSFNHLSIRTLAKQGLGPKTGLLFSEWIYEPWNYAIAVGAGALHPSYNVLQYPGLVAQCRAKEIPIRTWTVDLPGHMDLVLSLQPETLITNDPKTALARRAAAEANA